MIHKLLTNGRLILLIYLAINIIVFFIYASDKYKAKHHKWRIPESTLILCAVLGVIGAVSGMTVFHHKTRKPKFYIGIPVIFICEVIITAAVLYYKFRS